MKDQMQGQIERNELQRPNVGGAPHHGAVHRLSSGRDDPRKDLQQQYSTALARAVTVPKHPCARMRTRPSLNSKLEHGVLHAVYRLAGCTVCP